MQFDLSAVVLLSAILTLFIIRHIFKHRSFVRKYIAWWNSVLFMLSFTLIGYNFYLKGPRTGLVAVGFGAVAVGKYLWDKHKNPEDSDGH